MKFCLHVHPIAGLPFHSYGLDRAAENWLLPEDYPVLLNIQIFGLLVYFCPQTVPHK